MAFAGIFLTAVLWAAMPGGTVPVHDRPDTLGAAAVTSEASSIVPPRTVGQEKLRLSPTVTSAVRRFAGVQVRDYGGVGGLKTVNVRSLGSEHTGVFIDGIQVDNAQNMQVDLGRFGTGSLQAISIYPGGKVSVLQSAREYASASSLYLLGAEPLFEEGRNHSLKAGLRTGAFGTVAPSLSWSRKFSSGVSLATCAEAVRSTGKYRFHVKDYRVLDDGTTAGYDTTMTRANCDLHSLRTEARLFSAPGSWDTWSALAGFYASGRGLPGPVYKRADEYPLSLDRQKDRDFFLQGRWARPLGRRWTVMARAKLSCSFLEYQDFPEFRPEGSAAVFTYTNSSAYASAAALFRAGRYWKLNLAQDLQYSYLDANLASFAYPGRTTSYSAVSAMFSRGGLDVSASLLLQGSLDTFASSPGAAAAGAAGGAAAGGTAAATGSGAAAGAGSASAPKEGRGSASRTVLMPSLAARWKLSERFSLDGFARRTFRMPTFNDLYYTTVGSKSLLPEDALQFSFGAAWSPLSGPEGDLSLKADVYRNYLRNKIIAVPTSNQFRWSMYNLGKVRMTGAELAGEYSRTTGRVSFGLAGRWSFQRASDLSDRDALTWKGQIPYIPLHSGSADLYATFDGWRLDLICFATGERFSTSANLPAYRLAPWTSLDAALAKEFKVLGRQATARLSLNNLLDEQYEVVDNYPMPGFNAMLNLDVTF